MWRGECPNGCVAIVVARKQQFRRQIPRTVVEHEPWTSRETWSNRIAASIIFIPTVQTYPCLLRWQEFDVSHSIDLSRINRLAFARPILSHASRYCWQWISDSAQSAITPRDPINQTHSDTLCWEITKLPFGKVNATPIRLVGHGLCFARRDPYVARVAQILQDSRLKSVSKGSR